MSMHFQLKFSNVMQGARVSLSSEEPEAVCCITTKGRAPRNVAMRLKDKF